MRLHMPFAGLGPIGPKPLRPYARAYAYRGLRALASLSMARSGGIGWLRVGVEYRIMILCVGAGLLVPGDLSGTREQRRF